MKLRLILIALFITGCATLTNPAMTSSDPIERGLGWISTAIVVSAIIRAMFH